jgi:hypothetical protein
MITLSNRKNPEYAAAYNRAVTATGSAERASTATEATTRTADRDEALAHLAEAAQTEAGRLAGLADTPVELIAELVAMLFRGIRPAGGEKFTISGTEPLSGLAEGLVDLRDTRTVHIGAALDDLASSWEEFLEPAVIEATSEDFAADCRRVLKSPESWKNVSLLTILALDGDLPD